MKKFWETMEKDIQEENFTKSDMFVYGILYPLILVLTAIIISIIEDMVNNNYL